MSGLGTVALVAACIWMGVLTLVLVLVIRQIALLTVRLSNANHMPAQQMEDGFSPEDDGPQVGDDVPDEMIAVLPELENDEGLVLLMSATCMPCRELAADLGRRSDELPRLPTVALVPGSDVTLVDALVDLLPKDMRVVNDPDATQFANALKIKSTPFGIAVNEGKVVGKSYLHGKSDVTTLAEETEKGGSEESRSINVNLKEVTHDG